MVRVDVLLSIDLSIISFLNIARYLYIINGVSDQQFLLLNENISKTFIWNEHLCML